MQQYNFTWNQLGDIKLGRPNLGPLTNVAVYRLMQYTMRAVLEKEYGNEKTRQILVEAGRISGMEFCKNMLDASLPLNKFVAQLQEKLLELLIGVLKVEKAEPDILSFVVTVSEDLDCSGVPVTGNTICNYDEGFIEGIFNVYTGKQFVVKEVDCWSTGESICRFVIDLRK
jgi:hypothetical protein